MTSILFKKTVIRLVVEERFRGLGELLVSLAASYRAVVKLI